MSEMTTKTQVHPWFVWESEYAEGCTIIAATSADAAQEEYRRMSGADPETPLDAKPVTAEDVVRLEEENARLAHELDESRRALQFYKDREAHYARVLGVDDGGQFRADWDGAIDRLVRRATAAEARVRELEERIVALEAQLTTRGACRVCGCTDDLACEGSCYWVEPDLCSACAPGAERCPHAAPDENEQPTDDPCPFGRPCPFHDAREVRRG